MIAPFGLVAPGELLFGRGRVAEAPKRIAAFGRRVMLVHGADPARSAPLAAALRAEGAEVLPFAAPCEPDAPLIEGGLEAARTFKADVVAAMGGGAAIDAGKAIAALAPASRPMMDHLEVVGRGLPLDVAPSPFVALPTTAGTGAEATRNAVIGVPEHRRKVSLRDARMLPRLALIDPALTDACPRAVTLASGLDAIAQLIEPFVCVKANPLTDALCRAAAPPAIKALRRLMEAEDASARDAMAWASLCGGLALANAGLGAVHGLAGPLGGLTGAAHGAICGALLPHVMRINHARAADKARLDEAFGWIGAAFEMSPGAAPDEIAGRLEEWSRGAGLPGLRLSAEDRALAAEAALSSSSMKANPAKLTTAELEETMRGAD